MCFPYDCEGLYKLLKTSTSRGRYYHQKTVSHEPMHRLARNFTHFFGMRLWVSASKVVHFCHRGRPRGRNYYEFFNTPTWSGLTFSKLHMQVQDQKLNWCNDFHKWAWLNASVAPPRKFQKLSPALQIVREKWILVHLYILTRRTKKSLGAMTLVQQEVGHFESKNRSFAVRT